MPRIGVEGRLRTKNRSLQCMVCVSRLSVDENRGKEERLVKPGGIASRRNVTAWRK